MISPSGEGVGTLFLALKLALSKGQIRIDIYIFVSDDGNRSSFGMLVFSTCSYFEFRTKNKLHKLSDFECYTLSSEPFSFH
jgi:hypothetical protein